MARKREHARTADEMNGGACATENDAELATFADSVVAYVNESLKRVDVQHDAISNFLFSSTCDGDVDAAFGRSEERPPRLKAIEALAGGRLRLGRTALSRHVRVGAINAVIRDSRWHALEWTRKLTLLPLFKDSETGLASIVEGLDAHETTATTTRELGEWVRATRTANGDRPGRKNMTIASARHFAKSGALLADPEVLLALARRLNKLEGAERQSVVANLETIAQVVPHLLSVIVKP